MITVGQTLTVFTKESKNNQRPAPWKLHLNGENKSNECEFVVMITANKELQVPKAGILGFHLDLEVWSGGWPLPLCSEGKESACNEGDAGSVPRKGRSPGEGNGHRQRNSKTE